MPTSGVGGGITSLGGQTNAAQTFAVVNDTNITVSVGSSGGVHTFTAGFTGTLAKARQHAATVYTDGTYANPAWITSLDLSKISGATANRVLYSNGSGVPATEAAFSWNTATKAFILNTDQIELLAPGTTNQFNMRLGSVSANLVNYRNAAGTTLSIIDAGGAFASYTSGVQKVWHGSNEIQFSNDSCASWKSNVDVSLGSVDVRLCRDIANRFKVIDGAGTLVDLSLRTLYAGTSVSIGTSGTGAVDLSLGTVPANPAAGYLSLWADTADGRLKTLTSAGVTDPLCTVANPCGASGGGVGEWSSTIDFANILDLACIENTFTATGLTTGTPLLLVTPAAINTSLVGRAWASAADTAKVQLCNTSGADINPASASFTVKAARGYLNATATIDYANICAGCTVSNTITVTGATTSFGAVVSPPSALSSGLLASARVTAADTVTVSIFNASAADINPASGSFTAMVIQ